ncbi:MAG: hypothetical protein HYS23_10845 [Geobacter sp.]|nr:hypothetical protein [Geobacter sp.]
MAQFKHDPSISFIDIREPDVHEVYRSKFAIIPAGIEYIHKCEAFFCSAKDGKGFHIYIALLDIVSRDILVYIPREKPADLSEYDLLKEDALSFLSIMGFSMEPINLKFSAAMRQVIIRDIRVMHPPAPKAPPIRGITKKGPKVIESEPPAEIAVDIGIPLHETAAAEKILRASLPGRGREEAPHEPEKELVILPVPESIAAPSPVDSDEIERLKSALEEALVEKKDLEEKIRHLSEQPPTPPAKESEAKTDELSSLKAETALLRGKILTIETDFAQERASLSAELDRLRGEKSSREEELAQITTELEQIAAKQESVAASTAGDIESLRNEMLQAIEEKKNLEDELEALRNEMAELGKTHEARETELEEQLAKVRVRLSEKETENRELLDGSAAEIASLKEELMRLGAEKDAFAAAVAGKFREAKAAFDRAMEARQASEQELAELRCEYEALLSERQAAPPEEAPPTEAPHPAAAVEQPSVTTPPPGLAPEEAGIEEIPQPEKILQQPAPEAAAAGTETSEELDPFAFMKEAGAEGLSLATSLLGPLTNFLPAVDKDFVEYGDPEEVRDIYQSINAVEFNPGGHYPQKCNAYVCAVGSTEAPEVYLVWHLLKEEKILVYVPQQQPQDPESYSKILKDATYYFESIGFMLDQVSLPSDPKKRTKAIEKVPALRRI